MDSITYIHDLINRVFDYYIREHLYSEKDISLPHLQNCISYFLHVNKSGHGLFPAILIPLRMTHAAEPSAPRRNVSTARANSNVWLRFVHMCTCGETCGLHNDSSTPQTETAFFGWTLAVEDNGHQTSGQF